jgi:carbon monoxide dehydrogenase subunit G
MVVTGKIRVQAPIKRVWDTLLEPETLQACLSGIERIERLDERNYTIIIAQKVGPLTARFKMKATLTRVEAPTHLELEGQREDIGNADRVVHKVRIDLHEIPGNCVEISYATDANIGGALAIFADRIIQAKVKKIEAEFTNALQKRLDSRA